jgi:ribosomal protein L11 methyltransferase
MKSDTPYQDLYVFVIKGSVNDADETGFGEGFIGNWVEDNTSFLFFPKPSRQEVLGFLKKRPELEFLEEHLFSYEEWQGGGLEPTKVERFLIVPPWDSMEAEQGMLKILLDAGVVFGTGLHPTTRGCLSALLHLRKHMWFRSVMDLGTGTGILSLAAALLGAEQVLAVDLNPLCAKTALRNVCLNGLERVIKVIQGDAAAFLSGEADLILANVHYDLLIRLLEVDDFGQKEWLILSGLLRSQARSIEGKLSRYHLEPIRLWDHEGTWYTMLVKGNGKIQKVNHENKIRGEHESRE